MKTVKMEILRLSKLDKRKRTIRIQLIGYSKNEIDTILFHFGKKLERVNKNYLLFPKKITDICYQINRSEFTSSASEKKFLNNLWKEFKSELKNIDLTQNVEWLEANKEKKEIKETEKINITFNKNEKQLDQLKSLSKYLNTDIESIIKQSIDHYSKYHGYNENDKVLRITFYSGEQLTTLTSEEYSKEYLEGIKKDNYKNIFECNF